MGIMHGSSCFLQKCDIPSSSQRGEIIKGDHKYYVKVIVETFLFMSGRLQIHIFPWGKEEDKDRLATLSGPFLGGHTSLGAYRTADGEARLNYPIQDLNGRYVNYDATFAIGCVAVKLSGENEEYIGHLVAGGQNFIMGIGAGKGRIALSPAFTTALIPSDRIPSESQRGKHKYFVKVCKSEDQVSHTWSLEIHVFPHDPRRTGENHKLATFKGLLEEPSLMAYVKTEGEAWFYYPVQDINNWTVKYNANFVAGRFGIVGVKLSGMHGELIGHLVAKGPRGRITLGGDAAGTGQIVMVR